MDEGDEGPGCCLALVLRVGSCRFWATLQWDSDRILSVGCAGDGEPPEGRLGPIPVVVLRSRAAQRLGKLSLPTWQGLLGTLVRLVRTGGCGWNYAPQPRRTSPGSERDD